MSKNPESLKKLIEKGKPYRFSSTRQPSKEARERGKHLTTIKKHMAKTLRLVLFTSLKDFEKLEEEFQKHPEKYTIATKFIYEYIKKTFGQKAYTFDFLDRVLTKADNKADQDTGEDNKNYIINIKFDDKNQDNNQDPTSI